MREGLLSVFTVLCITPCSFLKESYNGFSLDDPMIFYWEIFKEKQNRIGNFRVLALPFAGRWGRPAVSRLKGFWEVLRCEKTVCPGRCPFGRAGLFCYSHGRIACGRNRHGCALAAVLHSLCRDSALHCAVSAGNAHLVGGTSGPCGACMVAGVHCSVCDGLRRTPHR